MSDITNWRAAVVVTLTVYSTHLLKWKRPWDTGNETAVVPGITELDCSGADWQKTGHFNAVSWEAGRRGLPEDRTFKLSPED